MPKLAGFDVRCRTGFRQCSVVRCDGPPVRRMRLEAATVMYLGLCERHAFLTDAIPVTVWAADVSPEEWIVGEVMES